MAVVVVPPLLKYTAGPLLGPAMLVGAARKAGYSARTLDLNIRWIRRRSAGLTQRVTPSAMTGDHDKPRELLASLEATFRAELGLADLPDEDSVGDRVGAAAFDRPTIERAAHGILGGADRAWVLGELATVPAPRVLGISILSGIQVYWARAITLMAREVWPATRIVWGGPHVTALRDSIASDAELGDSIDGFVFGHAEQTFVDLLDAVANDRPWPPEVQPAGIRRMDARSDGATQPWFDDLQMFGTPRLTIPAQISRGCAYGRCTYCTYPAIEGHYQPAPVAQLAPLVRLAVEREAALSLKDSLVTVVRLREVAEFVAGRVQWSACTKLHGDLPSILPALRRGGCDTLELGLETILPGSQQLIEKRQGIELVEELLASAREADVGIVLNYMLGFPGEDPTAASAGFERVRELFERSQVRGRVEVNTFQLERLAPLARDPHLAVTRSWPWSSILAWEESAHRRAGIVHTGRTHLRVL